MLAAVEAGVPVFEYTPAEIKRAVVGYGRAEKAQVQQMVKLLLGLSAVPSPHDAADALAVAICHVHSQPPARAVAPRQPGRAAAQPARRAGGPIGLRAERSASQARTIVIAHLRGTILEKHPNRIVIDVNGVGYDVFVPLSTFYGLGDPGTAVALRIHTHVREDALVLYGFATLLEQELFERLIGVSGIGPKLALAVLSGIEPIDLMRAIERGDVARLTAIPGVGKKTSERIVLELKDRLPRAQVAAVAAGGDAPDASGAARRRALGAREPGVSSASRRESRRRRDQDAGSTSDAGFEHTLKQALRELAK